VRVYLDHAASAPVRPEALEAYTAALATRGNPSSIHADGRAARAALEDARERLAAVLDADPIEVVFTAGGTEAINLAIKGLWWAGRAAGRAAGRDAIVTTAAEHHATLDAVEWLLGEGAEVRRVSVDAVARVRLDEFEGVLAALGPRVAVASMLWANNEVGTIEDVAGVAAVAAAHGVPLHWDAVAAFGHVSVSFRDSGAAALSVSGHKIGAPIGTGALVVRRGTEPAALVHGGGQQSGRSGTLDVAGAVALATAAELAARELDAESARLRALAERLAAGIRAVVPDAELRGDPVRRLPGHVHATFPGLLGETLLFLLDSAGFSVSVGSACRAGVAEPSHVLLAMGLDEPTSRSALRVTLGRDSTAADVDAFLAALPDAVARARAAY